MPFDDTALVERANDNSKATDVDGQMSGGTVAGLVVGSLMFVALLALLGLFVRPTRDAGKSAGAHPGKAERSKFVNPLYDTNELAAVNTGLLQGSPVLDTVVVATSPTSLYSELGRSACDASVTSPVGLYSELERSASYVGVVPNRNRPPPTTSSPEDAM